MSTTNTLDKFGEFLLKNFRDSGIDFAEGLLVRHWKSKKTIALQKEFESFSDA